MEDQEQAVIGHILEVGRRLYLRNFQLGGERNWAGVDLTMAQLKALFMVVSLGRVTMSQLARAVGITLSTATGVADRLVGERLVRRVDDPDDRRLVWLLPTKAAAALVDHFTQIGEGQLRLVARHLTLEELSLMAQVQDRVYQAMLQVTGDEMAAERGGLESSRSGR